MAEREEELNSLLMRVRKESKEADLTQHSKNEDHGIHPITSCQIDMETMTDFIFLGYKISVNGDCTMKLKDACSLEEKL